MKTIQAYIESKQNEFGKHPFFNLLQQFETKEEINYFVPELTFWAMTFQDILRINEEKIKDPYFKKIARHHRMEDSGHEKWFLHDKGYLSHLGEENVKQIHDIAWLYSKECRQTRDAVYEIVSTLFDAETENEYLNVILLLVLESSGHVFFEKVSEQVKHTDEDGNLRYFSSSHLEVEKAHALFETEMERTLFETVLDLDTKRQAVLMIERCYKAFHKMFDRLVITCNRRTLEAQEVFHAKKAAVPKPETA